MVFFGDCRFGAGNIWVSTHIDHRGKARRFVESVRTALVGDEVAGGHPRNLLRKAHCLVLFLTESDDSVHVEQSMCRLCI